MPSSTVTAGRRATERFGWTITAVRVLAALTAAAYFIGPIFNVVNLVAWLQPHAAVPVELSNAYPLPAPTDQNSYSGTPYIADGHGATVTQTQASVTGLSTLTIVMLALTPMVWNITAALIALFVTRAAGSLRSPQPPGPSAVRMLHFAAAALGIGSTLAQLVQAVSNLGLGHVAWNSPVLGDAGSFSAGATTFSFLPLIATIGILAAATALNRALGTNAGDITEAAPGQQDQ